MPSRVLLIDDSLTVRKITERQLMRAGLQVTAVSTGVDGVRQAIAHPPDVVVVDYMLPDLMGTDICDRLERDPTTRGIPVIVLSGRDPGHLESLFRGRAAVKACMAKPFEASELVAKIREVAPDSGGASIATPALATPAVAERPRRPAFGEGDVVESFVDEILRVLERPATQRRLMLRILVRKYMGR